MNTGPDHHFPVLFICSSWVYILVTIWKWLTHNYYPRLNHQLNYTPESLSKFIKVSLNRKKTVTWPFSTLPFAWKWNENYKRLWNPDEHSNQKTSLPSNWSTEIKINPSRDILCHSLSRRTSCEAFLLCSRSEGDAAVSSLWLITVLK